MKRLLYISLVAVICIGTACKKYVEIPPPENQLVSQLVFADDKTATASVIGLYATMNAYNSSFANYMANLMPSMSADDMYYSLSSATFNEFRDNNLATSNSYVARFWEPVYSYIYHANSLIEGLTTADNVSAGLKKQLLGEAYFLRAFYYFYLVNFFGDVPLILNTDYKVNTSLPRTAADKVYASVVSDLLIAQDNLADNYPSTERIRANKAAATTLLARTYLYLKQWDKAEAEASKVIADTRYSLLTDLNGVFLKNSSETILQFQSINKSTAGVNTWEGFSIVPAAVGGRAYYNMHDKLLAAFDATDKRKTNWTNTYVLTGVTYYYPYKYKIRTKTTVDEYSMVLRLAELYLIRAEARAQQNKLTEAKADIDAIRARAGIGTTASGLTKEAYLLIIENERWKELFTEWGHRWLDLKRTGRALTVLKPYKPDLTETDLLFPIPTSAMLTNPNLTQNAGY